MVLPIWVFVDRRAISPFNDICHRFQMEIGTGRGGATMCHLCAPQVLQATHLLTRMPNKTKEKQSKRLRERKRSERSQVGKKAQ